MARFQNNRFKDWVHEHFDSDDLAYIAESGADRGALLMTTDIAKVYEDYRRSIWAIVAEDALAMGEAPLSVIGQAKPETDNHNDFVAAIVHYAAERIAQEWVGKDR